MPVWAVLSSTGRSTKGFCPTQTATSAPSPIRPSCLAPPDPLPPLWLVQHSFPPVVVDSRAAELLSSLPVTYFLLVALNTTTTTTPIRHPPSAILISIPLLSKSSPL